MSEDTPLATDDPADLTVAEAGARLRAGTLTAEALTQAHLARIDARDAVIGAFVHVAADRALAAARESDRELAAGLVRGPLHGIPIAIKDLIDTAGLPTAYGSRLGRGQVPDCDAAVVARLKAAGAIILGKVATYEFALVGPSFDLPFPPARNPWDPAHITGGSSSGSAAAVAGGMVRASIGTDTGGSVRSPAGYCGVVGLKPTSGRVPRDGVFPLSPSLDHVGPLAASVHEAALVFDAIADPAHGRSPAASRLAEGIEGLRIAYARDWFATDPMVDPRVVAALDEAASTLSLLGARIQEVSLPDYGVFEAAGAVILHAEALEVHAAKLRAQGGDYGRLGFQTLASGLLLTSDDLAEARRGAHLLRSALDDAVFGGDGTEPDRPQCDALLTANTLTPALPFSAFDGQAAVWTPMRTLAFNVTGHPALAVPAGFARGLPLGLQLVGRRNDEAMLCRIGEAFERATDVSVMRPPPPPTPQGA